MSPQPNKSWFPKTVAEGRVSRIMTAYTKGNDVTDECYAINVLQREKKKLNRKLVEVITKSEYSPSSELASLLDELKNKAQSVEDRLAPEFIKWIDSAAKKEKLLIKQMHALANGGSQKLWDKRLEIDIQIGELEKAIFSLSKRKW